MSLAFIRGSLDTLLEIYRFDYEYEFDYEFDYGYEFVYEYDSLAFDLVMLTNKIFSNSSSKQEDSREF